MTNGSNDRLEQIEAILVRSIIASDERMTRLEQRLELSTAASDERLTRIEQAVESNNRFLESFSTDIRHYVDTMNNFAARLDGVIATSNQDRLESNSRLAVIQRQVSAIAKHLGVI